MPNLLLYSSPSNLQRVSPVLFMQDQIAFNRSGRSHLITPRGSAFAPSRSFVAEENLGGEKSTNQRAAADSISEILLHASPEGRRNRGHDSGDLQMERSEELLQGTVPPTTIEMQKSAPRSSPDDKRDHADDSEPASGDPASSDRASGDPASTLGGVPTKDGALPADGEWAEEIRKKDELISTLKRQLTALGEQPIEEVVTLEVKRHTLYWCPPSIFKSNLAVVCL